MSQSFLEKGKLYILKKHTRVFPDDQFVIDDPPEGKTEIKVELKQLEKLESLLLSSGSVLLYLGCRLPGKFEMSHKDNGAEAVNMFLSPCGKRVSGFIEMDTSPHLFLLKKETKR